MGRPLVTEPAMRELAVVLVVGLIGLLVAGLVAFAPWYEDDGAATVKPSPAAPAEPPH